MTFSFLSGEKTTNLTNTHEYSGDSDTGDADTPQCANHLDVVLGLTRRTNELPLRGVPRAGCQGWTPGLGANLGAQTAGRHLRVPPALDCGAVPTGAPYFENNEPIELQSLLIVLEFFL